ncbi:MAG: hypothetical protein HUT38_00420 [Candidatus Paceibacter sp.]|nr:hypothetical protein [Candidatus Paceibacter sp.]
MDEKKSSAPMIIGIIIALAVIGVIVWLFAGRRAPAPEVENGGEEQMMEDSLTMMDQKPGRFVNVREAKLSKKGFIAIHEEQAGGPGSTIGNSSLLNVGTSRDTSVTLSRRSVAGENMYAMLHWDNGDGVYNTADDQPAKDKNGNTVVVKFKIRDDASEPVDYKL